LSRERRVAIHRPLILRTTWMASLRLQ